MTYTDKNYEPDPRNDYVFEFQIRPLNMSLEAAGERILEYTSMRDWDLANKDFPKESVKIKPKLCDVDSNSSLIWLAYPREIFEDNNPSVLISLYHYISSLGFLRSVRLTDLHIPQRSKSRFYGPRYGLSGVDKRFARKGPFISVVLERSFAMTPSSQAKFAYELWNAGVDIVREDYTFTDSATNDFFERTERTMAMLGRIEKETGKRRAFIPNIASEPTEMVRRADHLKALGCETASVDVASCGISAIGSLRKHSYLFIIGNTPFSQMEMHDSDNGISPLAASKISALSGIDSLYLGRVVFSDIVAGHRNTRFHLDQDSAIDIVSSIRSEGPLKPLVPMISGGMHPADISSAISLFGKDVMLDFDECCYDHPDGPISGAKALDQARQAIESGVPLERFSKGRRELDKSLNRWSV